MATQYASPIRVRLDSERRGLRRELEPLISTLRAWAAAPPRGLLHAVILAVALASALAAIGG